MFVFGIFFQGLAMMAHGIFTILYWLLFARILISWLQVDTYSGPAHFLVQVTEPVLAPLRRIPLQIGILDLTPLIAFFLLFLADKILVTILMRLAYQFS